MNFYRVKTPALRVLPLRKIESGMTTEQSVFSRDDQVIAESGTPITDDRKRQFEEHGVRRVVVTEEQIQWVSEEELDQLSGDIEVLEEKAFDDAAEEIVRSILNSNSVRQMRKVAQHLRGQAEKSGDQDAVDRLDTLIDRSYELEEEIEEISEQLDQVEDEDARASLYEALEGAINELESTFLEITAPDSILNDSLRAVNEREDFRRELIDFVDNNPEFVEDEDESGTDQVIEDEVTEENFEFDASEELKQSVSTVGPEPDDDIETLLDKNLDADLPPETEEHYEELKAEYKDIEAEFGEILDRVQLEVDDEETQKKIINALTDPDSFHKTLDEFPITEELQGRISKFWEKQEQFQKNLWDASQDVGSLDTEAMENALDEFSDGEIEDGINELKKQVEQQDNGEGSTELKAQLQLLEKRNEEIQEERTDILEELDDVDIPEDEEEDILAMVQGDEEYDAEKLADTELDPQLKERIGDHLEEEEEFQRDILSQTDEAFGGALSELSEHDDELEDKMEEVERNMQGSITERKSTRSRGGEDEDTEEEQAETEESFDSLKEYVSAKEHNVIAREKGLDQDNVENAQKILEVPDNLNATQADVVEPVYDVLLEAFYDRHISSDSLADLAHTTAETMASFGKPAKLLVDPQVPDKYIVPHIANSFMISMLIGAYLDYDEQKLLDLGAATLCEDLGMVEISQSVWAKDDELKKHERRRIEQHPNHSREITKEAVNGDFTITNIVEQHHERADGSGYPKHLSENDLHPLSTVLGISDAYSAMLETRKHRSRLMPDKAMNTLIQNKEKFNGKALKALMQEIGIYPNGAVGILSDGRLCVVNSQNKSSPLEPKVFILTDSNQNKLDDPFVFDITDDPSVDLKKLVRF